MVCLLDANDFKLTVAGPAGKSRFGGAMSAFCPNLFVENTRARPTCRAEGDPFQCRERAGRAQGSPRPRAWTRDLAPRDPHYLVRLSSLDPDCPCVFPVADLLARFPPITASRHHPPTHVNRLPACNRYQHSLTVPYHTTLSAHHPNRTTTSVSIFVQPPPSQSSRYLHPALSTPRSPKPELGPPCAFPALIGPAQG